MDENVSLNCQENNPMRYHLEAVESDLCHIIRYIGRPCYTVHFLLHSSIAQPRAPCKEEYSCLELSLCHFTGLVCVARQTQCYLTAISCLSKSMLTHHRTLVYRLGTTGIRTVLPDYLVCQGWSLLPGFLLRMGNENGNIDQGPVKIGSRLLGTLC